MTIVVGHYTTTTTTPTTTTNAPSTTTTTSARHHLDAEDRMKPARVAVLGGGRSSEHEVSLASAASVRAGLSEAGHEPIAIEIGRDGVWRRDGAVVEVKPGGGLDGVDVVFPVLHGPFGEDGTVQGLLECLDVPYVGAGVLASALCMDKLMFKELMAHAGMPQVDYRAVRASAFAADREHVLAELRPLGLPVFVKPARLGSSVGIVRAAGADGAADALWRPRSSTTRWRSSKRPLAESRSNAR